jgi:hypothetical protein
MRPVATKNSLQGADVEGGAVMSDLLFIVIIGLIVFALITLLRPHQGAQPPTIIYMAPVEALPPAEGTGCLPLIIVGVAIYLLFKWLH